MTLARQLAQRWRDLGVGERGLILAGLAVLLPVALYLYLWQPMTVQRERLRAEVERLRFELASMRADAEDIAHLSQQPRGAGAESLDARAAAARLGIAEHLATLTPQGSERLAAEFVAVPFAAWLAWVGELGATGLAVEACEIEVGARPGEVRVSVTLAR